MVMDNTSWLTMVCEAYMIFFSISQILGLLLIKYFNLPTKKNELY